MSTYVELFVAEHGEPPWPCYGCSRPIDYTDYCVHHLNGDHGDDRLSNLVPMHRGCHTTLHHRGRVTGPEWRRKISETMRARGIQPSEEVRLLGTRAAARSPLRLDRVRATVAGKPVPEERRRKISEVRRQTAREECEHCNFEAQPGPLAMHVKHKHREIPT